MKNAQYMFTWNISLSRPGDLSAWSVFLKLRKNISRVARLTWHPTAISFCLSHNLQDLGYIKKRAWFKSILYKRSYHPHNLDLIPGATGRLKGPPPRPPGQRRGELWSSQRKSPFSVSARVRESPRAKHELELLVFWIGVWHWTTSKPDI